jgi:hypothetical protein
MEAPVPLAGSAYARDASGSLGIRHSSMFSIRNGPGLRAMTMGSHAGFRFAFDFGNPLA